MKRVIFGLLLLCVSSLFAEPLPETPPPMKELEDPAVIHSKKPLQSVQSLQSTQTVPPIQTGNPEITLPSLPSSLIVNPEQSRETVKQNLLPLNQQQEDDPMRKTTLSAILGAFMLATSSSSRADETTDQIKKTLETMKKQLDEIERKITLPDGSTLALQKIQMDLGEMRRKMAELESKMPTTSSISKRIDSSKMDPIRMGKVKFTNEWIEEVSVVLNGIAYEILPGNELTVPVPAGQFTYQVLNLQRRPQTRMVEAEKVWNVTINTR
jgi:hypothetical protein